MNGSAGRPGDARRDPGAPPGREPERAEFAIARVGSGSRWSPFIVAALTAIVMGMVGIAVGSRLASPPPAVPPAAVLGTFSAPTAAPTAKPLPTEALLRVPIPPVQTSDPSSKEIRLQVERQASDIFVHGDVYVPRVTWVFVSLRDTTGAVTGFSSVSVPGTAGPGASGGPTLRFDIDLAVPTDYTGPLTIQATAYDRSGHVIGATQLIADEVPR